MMKKNHTHKLSTCLGRKLMNFAKNLWQDDRGSLMPAVATSILVLTSAAGLTVDGARMFYVKDVLQKSLDSAGLAAGHALDINDMESDAQEFFDANIAAIGDVVKSSEMVINFSNDNKLITLTATASVDTYFSRIFGVNEVTVSADTEITRETRGMELVIVMDNTGSMRNNGKIDAAKEAAELLVEAVYGENDTNNNLWVGVVPYVAHVNVGDGHESWLSEAGLQKIDNGEYRTTEWSGCLFARDDGEDLTDTPPSIEPFEPWFWPDEPAYNSYYRPNNWIHNGVVSIYEANSRSLAKGPNRGCGQEILPLVASKTKVLDAIEEMEPWSFGGTATPTGLAWGWRVISPRWQGLWGGDTPSNLPLAHDAAFMDKVIVILTDGKNEFISRISQLGGSDYTAYGTIQDMGHSSIYDARDDVDDRFDEICTNIKDDDILIYGITFGSTPDSSTRSAFEACATNPGFYFHAPNNDELQDVFDKIGRQLSNLRLSK
ncbi:TadE/TadG family type IV pilus assembly protein [Kordiimonas laminariae]|uniref:TadE/TadG family type IV pilus assembly protein n=1 Tax=Kordiimonas laminariae TaxID=2917717 RepID=UPI001FF14C1B|nr:pilus assembly protein TadG-related protein [Kordiimonas laminariae]MCK0068191.1 pilus assembly protein TadG-related protein [Kordiimonas laminariae]